MRMILWGNVKDIRNLLLFMSLEFDGVPLKDIPSSQLHKAMKNYALYKAREK